MQKTTIFFIVTLKVNFILAQVTTELNLKFLGQNPIVYKVTMKPENFNSFASQLPRFSIDSTENIQSNENHPFYKILKDRFSVDEYFIINKAGNNSFKINYTNFDTTQNILTSSSKSIFYINDKGENLSFYLSDNINLISKMFFGLPKMKVKVGDTWSLGLDLTNYEGLVGCDSSFKKDKVLITEINLKNSDTIVTVKYDFQEFFQGDFYNQKTASNLKYFGTAVFSVKRGLWLSYNCFKETSMSSIIQSSNKEIYRLELLDEIPLSIKKLIE